MVYINKCRTLYDTSNFKKKKKGFVKPFRELGVFGGQANPHTPLLLFSLLRLAINLFLLKEKKKKKKHRFLHSPYNDKFLVFFNETKMWKRKIH